MTKWFYFLLINFSLFSIQNANAFLILTYKSHEINLDKPTRILVTGAGKEQDTQFQEVANGKALKYSELYPDEQIVLIAKNEDTKNSGQALLKRWGFELQYENKSLFDGESLIKEMSNYKNITSIDIFAHGTALYGLYLENTKSRLSVKTQSLKDLQGHFAADAYAILHGCNTGFVLAPFLSSVWNIPIAGSLTSSDFQRLHSDGSYYLTEEGYFPNKDWAHSNNSSFNQITNCRDGKCLRLKPDNHPYVGYWGHYTGGGLPFYKFFCVTNSDSDCQRVMAKSLFSFIGTYNLKPGATLGEYKNLLGDFLCPISSSHNYRRICRQKLDLALLQSDATFNPFRGPQMECDFSGCQVEFKCKKMKNSTIENGKSCYTVNTNEGEATTFVREYEAYLEGFKQLH